MQLVESIGILSLALVYLICNRHYPLEVGAVCAMLFAGLYLVVYFFIAPTQTVPSGRAGLLFSYVPMISFGAILFPELNLRSPAQVTRFFGWVGMVIVFLILCFMKLLIW